MSRLGLGLVTLVLLGALAMILFLGPTGDAYQVYVPEGYVEQVEEWIADGHLTYDCSNHRIEVADRLGPAEKIFYQHSYLEDDVDAWNQGDQRPFLVEHQDLRGGRCEGRLVGVNDSYHKQRLPNYVAEAWEGSLFLRPTADGATLTSGRRTLEVLPVPWRLLPLSADAFEDALLTPDRGGARSQRLALKLPPTNRAFATLKMVGDDPVLEVLSEEPELFLDSCPAELGWRLRLEEGDVLRAHQQGRLDERFQVETGERAGLVSFLTRVNGEPRRRNFPDRLAMSQDIAYAVDAVVDAARAENMEREDFDVHLSLDPFLSYRLNRLLAEFADRYGNRLPRVAVTVLEPQSGRLLALASHPHTGALKRLLNDDSTRRELLRRNHNFLQHPIGSATKPFLAAAALAAQPRLASLRLPCWTGGEPEKLLGYDMGTYNLPGDCKGAGEGGLIDLESFLEVSSNRYMLYLGLLSMADWQDGAPSPVPDAEPLEPENRYFLGGQTFRAQPFLPMVRYDDDRPGDGQTPLQEVTQQGSMPQHFEGLFGQGAAYRRERMVEALELELWEPVFQAAYGGSSDSKTDAPRQRPTAALAFSPVTPEQVNLRLNLAQQLRQDVYTVLLGNGNNRWSNVQLAEALARLVTGRQVQARLIERVSAPSQPREEVLWSLEDLPEPAALPQLLPEPARQRILAGMRRVVESPRGTAYEVGKVLERINEAAPEGVVYRALGKTGTPTLPLQVVRRSPVEAAPGAIVTYSGNRQVQSGVLVLAVERQSQETTEQLALTFFIDSQGGSEQAVALASRLLEPLVETYWPQDWLETRQ